MDITASSTYDTYNDDCEPADSRLDTPSAGWCAAINSYDPLDEWIMVKFSRACKLYTVITVGHGSNNEYIVHYRIGYKTDENDEFREAYNANGDVVFEGNTDMVTRVANTFLNPIVAVWVRLFPVEHYGWPSLRWELIGCLFGKSVRIMELRDSDVYIIENFYNHIHFPDRNVPLSFCPSLFYVQFSFQIITRHIDNASKLQYRTPT